MRRAAAGVIAMASLVAGAPDQHLQATAAGTPAARRILHYIDPMHPAYRSDRPGTAPDCGMDLVPVYDEHEAPRTGSKTRALSVEPDAESAAQLETTAVQLAPTARRWQTTGRVVADETRIYQVSAGVDGWVRRVFADRTGAAVTRGQRMAEFYSQDLSTPQQGYLYALDSLQRLKPGDPQMPLATQQLATARENLRFAGVSDGQIDALGRLRREFLDIGLAAPVSGRILEKRATAGQRFSKGDTLYRIADLSRVWVDAVMAVADLPDMNPHMVTRAIVSADRLTPLRARIAPVLPQYEDSGRIVLLRLEVDNDQGLLAPGMLVDVTLEGPEQSSLTVDASALIDVGRTPHVFIAQGHGRFEMREVTTGWQDADRIEIRSGLREGEQVVTAGAFLLDSESRLHDSPVHE
jgi:membrane fusion protein, copper/silver efflux system